MLSVKLDTGFNIEVDFAICPFHKRMIAWIIDIIIIVAYSWLIQKIIGAFYRHVSGDAEWVVILLYLPVLFYFLLCEVFLNGQSLGKKVMGIKVIATDGGQPTFSQYLIRWAFRLADLPWWLFAEVAGSILPWWCSVFLFAGIACVIASPKSQRLGDLVAGTILIDLKNKTSWEDTVFTDIGANYQPRFPQVMNLSDRDINTLKSIIDTIRKKNDHDLAFRIAERIKGKLHIESDQDQADFLETLLMDYNYYASAQA
jgi:uncharacterized RDD family membrane protein YckC